MLDPHTLSGVAHALLCAGVGATVGVAQTSTGAVPLTELGVAGAICGLFIFTVKEVRGMNSENNAHQARLANEHASIVARQNEVVDALRSVVEANTREMHAGRKAVDANTELTQRLLEAHSE